MRTQRPYPTAISGALNTYATLQGIDRNAAQEKRAQEKFGLDMAQGRLKLQTEQDAAHRDELMRRGQQLSYALEHGAPVDPQTLSSFLEAAHIDPRQFATPQTGQALDVLNQYAADPSSVDKQQVIDAANLVYGPRLNRNIGEAVPPGRIPGDGTRGTPPKAQITGKRIKDFYAGPDGKSIVFDLGIDAQDAKGAKYSYSAPMTHGRSAAAHDDQVLQVPITDLVDNLHSQTALYKMVTKDPRLRESINAAVVGYGGNPPGSDSKWGTTEIKRDGKVYTYRTQNGKPVGEPLGVSPQWKPTESKPDWGTTKINRDGKEETWITLNGLPVRRFASSSQWKPDKGGGGGTPVGELNLAERFSRNFWGKMDANGQFIVPPSANKNYAQTIQRFGELRDRGVPTGKALDLAAMSIAGPISEKEARKKAEREAADKFSAGTRTNANLNPWSVEDHKKVEDFISERTKELVDASQGAEREYEQYLQKPARGASAKGKSPRGRKGAQGLAAQYTATDRDGNPVTVSRADILATAKAHDKTPQQVIDDLELKPQ